MNQPSQKWMPLGEKLRSWNNVNMNVLPVPDQLMCETCHWLLPSHPDFETYFQERGFQEWQRTMVSCRCAAKSKEEQREQQLLFEASNLPLRNSQELRTFSNFRPIAGTQVAYDACYAYSQNDGLPILVLRGAKGCGKTHLLEAVGRLCIARGESVRYEQAIDLLDRIRATYSESSQTSTDGMLEQYRRSTLLILDDLGSEKTSEWVEERLLALVDERYRNGRRLLVATNVQAAAQDGSRIWSRLFDEASGAVRTVVMTASNFRTG